MSEVNSICMERRLNSSEEQIPTNDPGHMAKVATIPTYHVRLRSMIKQVLQN